MKIASKANNKLIAVVFICLVALIVILDMLINPVARLSYLHITDVITQNELLEDVWFAEAIAFILMPVLAFTLFHKMPLVRKLPWIFAGFTTLLFLCWRTTYNADIYSNYSVYETIHYTLTRNASDRHDYALESVGWEFLQHQAPFAIGLGAGYAVILGSHFAKVRRIE